jgi:hypothetical protein
VAGWKKNGVNGCSQPKRSDPFGDHPLRPLGWEPIRFNAMNDTSDLPPIATPYPSPIAELIFLLLGVGSAALPFAPEP